jgi:L-ascorbate metabolism protein UlaG (beta-lactamase superfamily)
MQLTWYGHSAFRLDFNGKAVLLDPFFTGNPAFEGDREAAIQGVGTIVLTHGHADHVGDTLDIAAKTGAKVVANYELCMWLSAQGLQNFDPMNTGGTVQQDGFSVSMVRADHSSAHMDGSTGVPLGSANGMIVTVPGAKTVYHMGDTDIFGDMALINEIYQPHVGLVPVGDRFTMGGKVAAMAVKRFFTFETVIPCHYATFGLLEPNADAFAKGLAGEKTKILVPQKGKAVTL